MKPQLHCLGILLAATSVACSSSSTKGTSTSNATSGSTNGGSGSTNGESGSTNGPSSGTSNGSSTGTGASTTGGTTGGSSTSGTTSGTSTGAVPDAGCVCDAGYCDPAGSFRCLLCLHDSDCTAPKDHCQSSLSDLNYGSCVECSIAEPACPAGLVCDVDLGRTYQQCVANCVDGGATPACPHSARGPRHCALSTGLCASGCGLDADCGVDGGRCFVDAGLCVACISASDCLYSQAGCDSSSQQCGSCTLTSDCPAGLTCAVSDPGPPAVSQCVCTDSSQCGGTAPVCVNLDLLASGNGGLCGCELNTDCASQDGFCALGRTYVPSCLPSCLDGGTNCAMFDSVNQYCNPTSGACGPCVNEQQCLGKGIGTYCLPRGSCGCISGVDCPTGSVCDPSGECKVACTPDAGGTHCVGQVCDTTTGLCVGCLSDSDCAASTPDIYCSSDIDAGNTCSQCLSPDQCSGLEPGCTSNFGNGFFCGFCIQASDCPADLPACNNEMCEASCVLPDGGSTCVYGVCQASTGLCVQCLVDADCQGQTGTPYCDTDFDAGSYNLCVQCRSAADCSAASPGCSSQVHGCGFCAVQSDCPASPASSAFCQYGTCGASCVLSDGGQSCAYGLCNTSTGLCGSCLSDSDCQSVFYRYCLSDIDAGNVCEQCVNASQCAPWPCNSVSYLCGTCGSNADCPAEAPFCASPPNGNCVDAG